MHVGNYIICLLPSRPVYMQKSPGHSIIDEMSDGKLKEEIAVLFHAANIGRTDVLQNAISAIRLKCSEEETIKLISAGRNEDGATPLHLAALAGHSDIIRYLLNANVDLDIYPSTGTVFMNKRPYDIAIESAKQVFHVYMFEQIAMGRVESIIRLLGGGVPAIVRDGFKLEDSTLHWACSFNSIEVAKVLLSYGIDVDGINLEGITPLHIAVKMLNVGMIKLLLSEGASPGILDHSGRAPIEHLPAVNETIEDLLKFPPTPTLTIRNTVIRRQSELVETNTGEAENENTTTSSNLLNHGMASEDSSKSIIKNGADVTASSNRNKRNRNASKLSVRLGELKDVHKEVEDDAPRGNELPLLVLWPPAKRQIQSNSDPFILRSSEVIVIHLSCETADIYPILRQSGLLEVLEHFKMETTVLQPGRGVTNGADLVIPKIRLCVDSDLCPGRHRFEIEVTSDKVSVLASDPQGGLYGLYALTQLFQLHSELHQRYDGVVEFKTNRIAIVDWPDVMNRAVMWSFRKSAQTGFAVLRDMVDFMSKLRVNVLYLIIDSEEESVAEHQDDMIHEKEKGSSAEEGTAVGVNGKSSETKDVTSNGHESNDALSSHITAFDEVCDAACVELVPTVTITSVKQRLSSTLLKKFNHAMICIVFAFDYASVRDELASVTSPTDNGEDVSDDACNAACRTACESILDTAAAIGFSAVTFTCSTWTLHVADPQTIARNKGMNAIKRNIKHLCPHALCAKPLYFLQDFIHELQEQATAVTQEGLSISMLPAFSDGDYLMPSLSVKYFTFLHAGFAWNGDATRDMIQSTEGVPNASILKEVLSLLLLSKAASKEPNDLHQAITNTLCGDIYFPLGGATPSTSPSSSQREGMSSFTSTTDEFLTMSALASSEKQLWSLLNSSSSVHDAACLSKAEASTLLRHYRKLLSSSKWRSVPVRSSGLLMGFAFGQKKKIEDSVFDSEVDAFYSTIQILSVLCRAIVLARNTREKMKDKKKIENENSSCSDVTFGVLMEGMAPGTKSDIANALLAALEHCAIHVKKRFKNLSVDLPVSSIEDLRNLNSGIRNSPSSISSVQKREESVKFISKSAPALPALAVLKTISDFLPLPKSVEETIQIMFTV